MNYDKLTETLRQHGVSCVRAHGRYCSICDEAATALSTLRVENEKLRAELERVKLVRCKDCKMSRPGGLGYVWCGPTAMPLDGFCSNGQQKED